MRQEGGSSSRGVSNISNADHQETLAGQQVGGSGNRRFAIEGESDFFWKRFQARTKEIAIKVLPPANDCDILSWLELALKDIFTYVTGPSASKNSRVGISISSRHLLNGNAGLSLHPLKNLLVKDLVDLIMGLAQSNTSFYVDESFNLNATFIDVPHGYGRKRAPVDINTAAKRSIVAINNDDDLCLPRALVVGEVYLKFRSNITSEAQKEWTCARDARRSLQRELALHLMRDTGDTIAGRRGSYEELVKFQRHNDGKQISIVAFDRITYGQGSEPFFDGRKSTNDKTIYLLYDARKKHFDAIINPVGVVKNPYFCTFCNVRFKNINSHVCDKICDACFQQGKCDSSAEKILCDKCYRCFYSANCLAKHTGKAKGSKYLLCAVVKIWQKCFV
uniref:C2H2-type domain-containing protein n=1 Tax=Trichogramma kaykai TaxID=54128 RepID=A0ABD2WD52_9HYME